MEFMDFARAHGLIIRDLVHGKICRCPTENKAGKRNGAFYFDRDFGWVQDWSIHPEIQLWKSDKVLTEAELKEQKTRMEASRRAYVKLRCQKQAIAADKAKWILEQTELDRHAYLEKKGFPKIMGNVWHRDEQDPLLCIPMYHQEKLCGVQLISSIGEKRFLTGQRCSDAYFKIGEGNRLFIVEGYASALSLQAILAVLKLPYCIMVAFSAGNMGRLANRHLDAFLICDNDESQTSQKVAMLSNNSWWMPPEVGMDINDYHVTHKLLKSSQALRKALQDSRKSV